jgi:hypothetical protein
LYGLRQAPRAWYEEIDNYLKQQRLIRSSMDEDGKVVILVIHVDNLLLIRNHTKRTKWITIQLINRFKMSQLGSMELYFQVEFFYFPSGIFMTHRGYVCLTFKELGLNECNINPTPMVKYSKLSVDMGEKHVDIHLYQKMVGKLYFIDTRLDISYVMGVVSRYMATAQKPHMETFKRIFR